MSESVYSRARRHALAMVAWLIIAITFVLAVDQFYGHSSIAFALAIVGLVAANVRMLSFNCPTCGKNLFFRGMFVVPWPSRTCGKCGTRLDSSDQAN